MTNQPYWTIGILHWAYKLHLCPFHWAGLNPVKMWYM